MNQYKPNWNVRTYSKDEFVEAWESSVSVADCIKKLGLRPHGGQHKILNMTAESLGLKKDHMLGQGANSGKNHRGGATPIPLSEILTENSGYNRYNLKRRLIKEGLLEERCQAKHCPSPVTSINGWTGEVSKTPLTLDHINGINNDNRVENLRLVCANCDRYGSTFSVGSTRTPARYECENRHVCSKHDTHCKKCLSTSISQNYRGVKHRCEKKD